MEQMESDDIMQASIFMNGYAPPVKKQNMLQEKVKVENSINTARSRLTETERELKATMDEVHLSFNAYSEGKGESDLTIIKAARDDLNMKSATWAASLKDISGQLDTNKAKAASADNSEAMAAAKEATHSASRQAKNSQHAKDFRLCLKEFK